MKNKKGFTLIELLVVIAIIGLLSTLAVVSLSSARSKARDAKRTSDLRAMQSAIELFLSENDDAPPPISPANPGQTWTATITTPLAPYLPGPIADPGSTLYVYCTDSSNNYLLAATLENDATQPGIQSPTGWATTECVDSDGGAPAALPSCDATTGFCLGSSGA